VSYGSRGGEQLQTARLSLRRPTVGDIDAIFEIHGDPRACLHNPSDRLTRREGAEELYQRWNEQWERCGYGYWVVRRRGSDVRLGFCGVKPMELDRMKVLNPFLSLCALGLGAGLRERGGDRGRRMGIAAGSRSPADRPGPAGQRCFPARRHPGRPDQGGAPRYNRRRRRGLDLRRSSARLRSILDCR
jgi:Acetyltransferase (GNAT) domain